MERILTKKTRDWKDLIIVTEKVDGSNVGIYKKDGEIYAISRAGYNVFSSKYEQHRVFGLYVMSELDRFTWLPDGWRIVGEWCLMAHGTIYDISNEDPFVAFDIIDNENNRIGYVDFIKLCSRFGIPTVKLLHIGNPISIKNALQLLGNGYYGASKEKPEGVVYRCERSGKVDFLAKWVRAEKEDGKYMKDDIWNIGADKYRNTGKKALDTK